MHKKPIPMILKLVAVFTVVAIIIDIIAFFGESFTIFGLDIPALSITLKTIFLLLDIYILFSIFNPNRPAWYLLLFFYGVDAAIGIYGAISYFIDPGEEINAFGIGFTILWIFIKVWIAYAIYLEKHYFFKK